MGFPSPAKDYAESELSLDEPCVKSKTATFFMRAEGNYPRVGIVADSILVVDRSRQPGGWVDCCCGCGWEVQDLHVTAVAACAEITDDA